MTCRWRAIPAPTGCIDVGRAFSAQCCQRRNDWQQAIEDAHRFVSKWGKQAEALGWTTAGLFGLHIPPEKPAPNYRRLSRYDQTGLIWLLRGRPVIALTETEATILAPSGANLTSLATEIAKGAA
jgi:hypothetical protein